MIVFPPQRFLTRVRVVTLALALACSLSRPAAAQTPVRTLVDLDGKALNPFQHANGKLLVFLFVRTDCPISNRYAPTIQELEKQYRKNAEFYLVYPVKSETSEQIRSHMMEFGYKLRVLRDPDGELVKAAQTKVTPEAAVFTANGSLLYHGRIDDWYAEFGRARSVPSTHELSAALEEAAGGKPVAVATMPAVGCYLPDVK
ncbi:MAG: redoxin family protein [Candidatus Acidiferrum sp.]